MTPNEPEEYKIIAPEKYKIGSVLLRFAEQLQAVDELTVVILKGHLLIEEALERIVTKFVHHGDYLLQAGLRFHQLVAIARSIDSTPDSNLWELILATNKLRNQLAHSLDPKKRQEKVEEFKAVCTQVLHPAEMRLPDHTIAKRAFAMCSGFLATLEYEVERSRAAEPSARGRTHRQRARPPR